MKKASLQAIVVAFVLLLAIVQPAFAQTYYFQVKSMEVNLYINSDGTGTLEYLWNFSNSPSADPIQYVDVGMPTPTYNEQNIVASVNNSAIPQNNITPFTDQYSKAQGITLDLSSQAIQPGQSGTVYMKVEGIQGLLYNSNKSGYAHFSFEPSWFGSDYVFGATSVVVTLYLPAGMNQNEPIYDTPKGWPGEAAPQSWNDSQGRVVYQWSTNNGSGAGEYTFGASFPSKLVPSDTLQNAPFLSLTKSDWNSIVPVICVLLCGGLIVWISIASANAAKKRKLQYLPPKIALEGNGIKRGLTPVEAGILMEQPLDKLLQMMLFSTVRKNAATVVTSDPLKLKITDPLPEGLAPYEIEFLRAFQKTDPAQQRLGLQDMMINLVKSVSEKMKGFSRKETVVYYDGIMKQAWQQIQQANTPEVKSQVYEQVMDWTMLDPEYGPKTQQSFGTGPVFVPMWWGHYDPTFRPSTSVAPAAQSATPRLSTGHSSSPINMPRLSGADFAASVTKGTQTMSTSIVGGLASFTGAVTSKTNPVPVPTITTSGPRPGGFGGGGGGHSCACACACACAGCACACAGGGR